MAKMRLNRRLTHSDINDTTITTYMAHVHFGIAVAIVLGIGV